MAAQTGTVGWMPVVLAGGRLSPPPLSRQSRPSTLSIQGPAGQTQTVLLVGNQITIGRSHSAVLSFPEDTDLSRQHCVLETAGGAWSVRDLGSRSGTFVNSTLLTAPYQLKTGDRITAGNLVMVFEAGGEAVLARRERSVVHETGQHPTPRFEQVVLKLENFYEDQTLVVRSGPLEALLRAGYQLSEQQPLAELIPAILDLAILAVSARRGVLMLLDGDRLLTLAHRGEYFPISRAVRDRVLMDESAVLVRDTRNEGWLRNRQSILDYGVDTVMAVPLRVGGRTTGLLYVDSPAVTREFTEEDLRLLTVMANVAAARIERARLAELEQTERKVRNEVEQAAEIQRCVLPERAPAVAGFDAAGFNLPCRTVGGDYYGFFERADGQLAVALGDVSGKGMPAALMTMALDAGVRVLIDDFEDLGGFLSRLNKATSNRYPSNRFITFVACLLDAAAGELRCANAGHCPPVLVRATGETEIISESSLVLGILPDESYRETRTRLAEGDLVVLYSDGITEACNARDEEFGVERLAALLANHRQEPAAAIVEAAAAALAQFRGGIPLPDDATLVVAKRVGKNPPAAAAASAGSADSRSLVLTLPLGRGQVN